ncbi:MAG: rhodanese-like domain-containing protein [Bacteroidales bacterium]|jgi:rhodanese-related sulfurtransferase|nr:rhodanese-like domain-containing protein [Bacteroidales bacterium]
MNKQYISAIDAYHAAKKGALLLDVREEFETTDIWMDMDDVLLIPFTSFTKLKNKIPCNRQIIVCCAIGIVSETVASILGKDGYKEVFVLENGLIAWKLANLPMKSSQEMSCPCQCYNQNKEEDED